MCLLVRSFVRSYVYSFSGRCVEIATELPPAAKDAFEGPNSQWSAVSSDLSKLYSALPSASVRRKSRNPLSIKPLRVSMFRLIISSRSIYPSKFRWGSVVRMRSTNPWIAARFSSITSTANVASFRLTRLLVSASFVVFRLLSAKGAAWP